MELDAMRRALAKLSGLPAHVTDWNVQVGEDASGVEAVWVWVTLAEEVDAEARDVIRQGVRRAIHAVVPSSPQPWVYVRFLQSEESATR